MQELYLQLQNLKRSDKYSLLLIAALFICLLIKFAALDPLQNRIENSKHMLAERQEEFENYLAFSKQHSDYGAFVKEQNEAALTAYSLVPENLNAAALIKDYTALASKHNLRIQSIRPVAQENEKKQNYQTMTFKITACGSFYKTAAFLEDIQNGSHLISIANVAIEHSKEDFTGDVILTAELTAYALK